MAERLEEIRLEGVLRSIRLHKYWVTFTSLACGGLMWIHMANQPNVYQATARLLIETDTPRYVQFQETGRPGYWDRTSLQTEYEVIRSRSVTSKVVEQLHLASFPPFSRSKDPVGLLQSMVAVKPVRGTKLVDLSLTGYKPDLVARIANAVADAYVQLNLERQRAFTLGGVQWLQSEVAKMEAKMREASLALQAFREQHRSVDFGEDRYNSVLQNLQALHAALNSTREKRIEAEAKYRPQHPELKEILTKERELQMALFEQEQQALEMSRLSIQYNTLLRDAKTSETLYNILLTRLKELSVQEGLQANNVQVVDYALVPENPIGPPRGRRTITAVFVGFLLGCGISILLELMTKTIRTRKEFEESLEIPFLGYIPIVPKRELKKSKGLLGGADPTSPWVDTVRSTRTTLEFILPSDRPHVLLVTSALPYEGKSFASLNLAIAFRELGRKVILVDADLRKPAQHKLCGVNLEPGLSAYLEGRSEKEEIVQMASFAQDGLPIVPAGLSPSQPTELLSSQRMRDLLEYWKAHFHYILLDSPPILVAADAIVLATIADGVVYVVRAGQTHREAASAGKQRLVDVGAKCLGGILNAAKLELEHGYRYYYYRKYRYGGYHKDPHRKRQPVSGKG